MMIFDPGSGAPAEWVVCFAKQCATLPWLPIGQYKHVRCFGCVPEIKTWLFFDPRLSGTVIKAARGDAARELVREFMHDADAVVMPAQPNAGFPLFGWCVPAVAHLIGARSALRPIALYRHCLAHGHAVAAAGAAA